jgi:molecular chaperone GrpE
MSEQEIPQDQQDDAPREVCENDLDINALRAERDEALSRIDQVLRAYAEADNAKKRAEKERSDALKYGAMKLARDLLDVADSLRHAIAAIPEGLKDTAKDFVDGIELTERALIQAFERHDIQVLNPKGDKFDPNFHEAISQLPIPGFEEGHIVDVMQAGYRMADRLLRPARVVVATKA